MVRLIAMAMALSLLQPVHDAGGTVRSTGTANNLLGITCPSADRCIADGDHSTVITTITGGRTWSAQTIGPASTTLFGIACPSADRCIAVGAHGTIEVTADSGMHWTTRSSGTTSTLFGVACVGTAHCIVVGPNGIILTTRDAGAHWMARLSVTTDQLNKALAQSDFVIFVLPTSDTNTNIYFEIGLALGQGKKLMVIAPGDAAAMPADLRELLIVKAQLDNDEAIGFPLDQFLAAPPSNGATAAPTAEIKGQPLGDTANALIQRVEALKNRVAYQSTNVDAHQELEQIVIEALEASHVAPVVASQGQDRQADLAVWVDELDSLGLNPLLIELKGRLDTWEAIDAAVDQAEAYLRSFRAQAILILFVTGPRTDREMPAPSFPNVLPLDLIDLLNRMRTKSFGTVLRAAIYDGMAANNG